VHSGELAWNLVGFIEHLDRWIEIESPTQDLRVIVTDWVFSRAVDPYVGARRERGFANLWYVRVPGSYTAADGTAVVCTFLIEETSRRVRCMSIATLSYPV
jgi:hypothetical protein